MTLTAPGEFVRAYAAAFALRDGRALAELCAEDATMMTLTGAWCEGRGEIADVLGAELTGTFAQARLVTGKGSLRALGPGAAVLHQRFVLTGLTDAAGRDAGRIGAMLTGVLVARQVGWQALSLHMSPLEG